MYGRKGKATYEDVYHILRDKIIHLEIMPGSAISEIETADEFDISRTPVRDAFKLLEWDGLLKIVPHRGSFVTLIDLRRISDLLYIRNAIEHALMKDLVAVYNPSYDMQVQLLLQKQKDLLGQEMSLEEMAREYIQIDNEFHYKLYALAGKAEMASALRNLNIEYERFRTLINYKGKMDLTKLYEEHMQIWECVKKKDLDTLLALMTDHVYAGINSSADIINKYSEYMLPIEGSTT